MARIHPLLFLRWLIDHCGASAPPNLRPPLARLGWGGRCFQLTDCFWCGLREFAAPRFASAFHPVYLYSGIKKLPSCIWLVQWRFFSPLPPRLVTLVTRGFLRCLRPAWAPRNAYFHCLLALLPCSSRAPEPSPPAASDHSTCLTLAQVIYGWGRHHRQTFEPLLSARATCIIPSVAPSLPAAKVCAVYRACFSLWFLRW